MRWVIVVVVCILGLFLLGSFVGSNSDAPHAATGCSASKRAVEGRLKAPTSAKWGDCHSTTANGVQSVTVMVDAQNSFGAMIRMQWLVTVRNNNVESITQLR